MKKFIISIVFALMSCSSIKSHEQLEREARSNNEYAMEQQSAIQCENDNPGYRCEFMRLPTSFCQRCDEVYPKEPTLNFECCRPQNQLTKEELFHRELAKKYPPRGYHNSVELISNDTGFPKYIEN